MKLIFIIISLTFVSFSSQQTKSVAWQYLAPGNPSDSVEYDYEKLSMYLYTSTNLLAVPESSNRYQLYDSSNTQYSIYLSDGSVESNTQITDDGSFNNSYQRHFLLNYDGSLGVNSRHYVLYKVKGTCICYPGDDGGNSTKEVKISGRLRVFVNAETARDFFNNDDTTAEGGSGPLYNDGTYVKLLAIYNDPSYTFYNSQTVSGTDDPIFPQTTSLILQDFIESWDGTMPSDACTAVSC